MTRLERATYLYVVVSAVVLVSLLWWSPSLWLAIVVGFTSFVIGSVLATLLVRRDRALRQ